jgi:hypothetical protein
MKTLALIVSLMSVASVATDAVADDNPGLDCHNIHAVIVDTHVTDGCTTGFCAGGTVRGNFGFDGTTFFTLDGFVLGPAIAGGFNMSTGLITYTLRDGTITAREVGTGDMGAAALRGVGSSLDQITGGTGRFAGATGTLYLAQSASGGFFTSLVSGELCLPH